MRPKDSAFRSFVYLELTRSEVIEKFAHLADGAAYPAIRPDVVAGHLVSIPGQDLLQYFDLQVHPSLNAIGQREEMSETLASVRDTLLPKLLSGQLRIPDAEKQVAEAL